MPSLEWNRKWERLIAEFVPRDTEPHFGDRWGRPEVFWPLMRARRRFLDPYVRPGQTVLEIGSGGGRITQFFLQAGRIIVVELNPASFDYLRRRFAGHVEKFQFYHTTGYEMRGISEASVDLVVSYDVFVHIDPEGILEYLKEIERVLRPSGRAVLHYSEMGKRLGRESPSFSRMTRALMEELLAEARLTVLDHDTEIMPHSNLVALEKP